MAARAAFSARHRCYPQLPAIPAPSFFAVTDLADSLLPTLLSVLLVGFLGGTHCIGMCGGIVGALSLGGGGNRWSLHLAYNLGRIASYGLAGLLAGAVGAAGALPGVIDCIIA